MSTTAALIFLIALCAVCVAVIVAVPYFADGGDDT